MDPFWPEVLFSATPGFRWTNTKEISSAIQIVIAEARHTWVIIIKTLIQFKELVDWAVRIQFAEAYAWYSADNHLMFTRCRCWDDQWNDHNRLFNLNLNTFSYVVPWRYLNPFWHKRVFRVEFMQISAELNILTKHQLENPQS